MASSHSGLAVMFSFSRWKRRPMDSTVCIFFFSSRPLPGFWRLTVTSWCSTLSWIRRNFSIFAPYSARSFRACCSWRSNPAERSATYWAYPVRVTAHRDTVRRRNRSRWIITLAVRSKSASSWEMYSTGT